MNSLERRLQLGLALSLVLLMGIVWVVGNNSIRGLTEDFVTSRLEHDAESLLMALVLESGELTIRWRHITQIYNQPLSGHYYVIHVDNDKVITSRSLWDQSLQTPVLALGEVRRFRVQGPAGQPLLVWSKGYEKLGRNITVAVAEDLSAIQQERDQFMRYFALLTLGGLMLLVLVQTLVIRRSFTRLETVREDIQRLEQGKTDKLSEDVPSEILPLVQEFNHLLALLSQRLERSRNALGNLAHALKGPLNLLIQYFDHPAGNNEPMQRHQARNQVERVRQLMERELKRARLAGRGIQSQHFNPHQDLPDLLEVLRQVHQERRLDIQSRIDHEVSDFGDREDMLELLGNLLDNACKWASRQVVCHIAGKENIILTVEDDGQGLSDRDLHRLTQRGTRLDETVEGHGLGLAIAKDIVKLYAGSMEFDRAPELGGLRVRIWLQQYKPLPREAGFSA
ncbi:MAG: sensor histidine kinase [Chromatiales bacterium]|jgi:signal transduction histidine kinase